MKHILLIITAMTILLATGCAKVENKNEQVSRFIRVENTSSWEIVVDKETGVMYAVSDGTYSRGIFTLLVDADGKPLIWDKVEQE